MKRISALIIAIVAIFVLAGHAKAAPMYYTFDGTVSSTSDAAGIIADAGLAVGSVVTYTLIVDFDADGTLTYNDGTVFTFTDDVTGPITVDWFFTDYVSGDALWQKDGGIKNDPIHVAEYNYGYDSSQPHGGLFGNSHDDGLTIYSGALVSGWVAGDAVTGRNYAFGSTGNVSELYAHLTLTSISQVTSVPEPSTLLLLGSGLAGLGFVRTRFKGQS